MGVCAHYAKNLYQYAHTPSQPRIRVNPNSNAGLLHTTLIMLSLSQVIHRFMSAAALQNKLSTG
jgi:hypothetical protein